MTDARQLNDAKPVHRPYPRAKNTDPRGEISESVPVLFSLPNIQSPLAHHEPDGHAPLATAARAASPSHEPLVRSQRPEIAAAQDHQSEAHAASVRTPTPSLSQTVVGIHPHMENPSTPATAAAKNKNWTNYAFNATIGVLVLALCFLVIQNSSQNRTGSPANRSNADSVAVPTLDPRLSQPSSVPTSVTWPAAPAGNPGSPASSPAQSNDIASPSMRPDVLRDTFSSQPTTPSIPATMATSQNQSLHLQPSHGQTPNASSTYPTAPQRAPEPPMSVPNLLPAGNSGTPSFPNTRPSMPAQGQAWDSSSLTPNASRRPTDSPNVARTQDEPDSTPLSFDEKPATETLAYAVTDPSEGVTLASATLDASETQPTHAASQTSPASQLNPIPQPASDAPELNTRDIIQLRQGQRKAREPSAAPVVNAAFNSTRTSPSNATATVPWNARPNANTTSAPNPALTMTGQPYPPVRRSYEPISMQADPLQQPTTSTNAATTAPPATRYQPVGSTPPDSASPPTTAPNSNASPSRPVQPYTPVSPVLPDPF